MSPSSRPATAGTPRPIGTLGGSPASIGAGVDDLAAGLAPEGPPGVHADAVLDEVDRAVGEPDVDAAGVIAPGGVEAGLERIDVPAIILLVIRGDDVAEVRGRGEEAVGRVPARDRAAGALHALIARNVGRRARRWRMVACSGPFNAARAKCQARYNREYFRRRRE